MDGVARAIIATKGFVMLSILYLRLFCPQAYLQSRLRHDWKVILLPILRKTCRAFIRENVILRELRHFLCKYYRPTFDSFVLWQEIDTKRVCLLILIIRFYIKRLTYCHLSMIHQFCCFFCEVITLIRRSLFNQPNIFAYYKSIY